MAIRIENLTYGYNGREVLRNISLTLEKGRFTIILGKNGSGKSTLFRLIAGLLKPWQGAMTIFGQTTQSLSLKARARILGFLPQHHRPVFPFRVEDVVLTGRAGHILLTPRRRDLQIVRESMARVGISHLSQRLFTELSGGEQQMVMIARVLAQDPQIILLDEPTTHLDFYYQARVLAFLRDLATQGYTVVAVLHDPNLAMMYGERFYFLKQGRLLAHEPDGSQGDTALLEAIYGMPLETVPFGDKMLVVPRL